jgi:hypothetical protein
MVERANKDYGVVVCVVDVAQYEVDVDATEKRDERTNVFYSVGCSCKRGHPASRDSYFPLSQGRTVLCAGRRGQAV